MLVRVETVLLLVLAEPFAIPPVAGQVFDGWFGFREIFDE